MNQSHDQEHKQMKQGRPIHKDWRVWTAVVLILAALASYVLTNDEVLRPAGTAPQAAPALPAK